MDMSLPQSTTAIGTLGGTLLTVINTIGPDIQKTVILALIGAMVSFITSLLLKKLYNWILRFFSKKP
jgi:prepilin signal peptidase PulO-like enzyme (type II secretory pathway)